MRLAGIANASSHSSSGGNSMGGGGVYSQSRWGHSSRYHRKASVVEGDKTNLHTSREKKSRYELVTFARKRPKKFRGIAKIN